MSDRPHRFALAWLSPITSNERRAASWVLGLALPSKESESISSLCLARAPRAAHSPRPYYALERYQGGLTGAREALERPESGKLVADVAGVTDVMMPVTNHMAEGQLNCNAPFHGPPPCTRLRCTRQEQYVLGLTSGEQRLTGWNWRNNVAFRSRPLCCHSSTTGTRSTCSTHLATR